MEKREGECPDKIKEAAPLARERPQANQPLLVYQTGVGSSTQKGDSMSDELKELRVRMKLPGRELVDVIKPMYPKFDKTVLSKCENGDVYGVQLRKDAMVALYEKFDPEHLCKWHKRDAHRLKHCIKARLPDDIYTQLQQLIRADGYTTVQEWLSERVTAYVKERTENSERTP